MNGFRRTIVVVFALIVASPCLGQDASPETAAGDVGAIHKGGRILPPGAHNPQQKPNGLELYNRMEVELPALPPEKKYDGPVDEAYGAYQRGYFNEAYNGALVRAQKGDPQAETLIAEMVDKKLIAEKQAGPASDWYRMAADSGEPFALNRYGMILLERGDDASHKKGVELIRKAAETGDPVAAFNYGSLLMQENSEQRGLEKALPWFEMSATGGVPDGEYALSQLYRALDNVPDNKKKRWIDWLRLAAEGEHETAQLDLALALINGDGVKRDIPAGVGWMHRAALNGNPAASAKLAYLYMKGIGTPVNALAAATFYLSAKRFGLEEPEMETFLNTLSPEQLNLASIRSRSVTSLF